MSYDQNNIFAKIIRGEIPCNKVYEDDLVLAFHDINPKAPVHVLVIPKRSYVSIDDFGEKATPDEIKVFFQTATHIARDLGVEEQGYRMVTNHKPFSGQEVYHFHLHILGGKPLGPLLTPS